MNPNPHNPNMEEAGIDGTHVGEDDLIEVPEEKAPLATRRPAELGTFIAAFVACAAVVGFDVDETAVLAFFVLIGVAPSIISHYVDRFRAGLRGE